MDGIVVADTNHNRARASDTSETRRQVQRDGRYEEGMARMAYGAGFFENYLANPQSKLLRLSKR